VMWKTRAFLLRREIIKGQEVPGCHVPKPQLDRQGVRHCRPMDQLQDARYSPCAL